MSKTKVTVNNIITHIRKFNYTEKRGVCICPLCRKEIKLKQRTYLLINNYKLFPNVIIHSECVLDNENLLPVLDWKATIKKLKKDYEQAKQMRNNNVCWFGKN